MAIEIRKIDTKSGLRKFVKWGIKLYDGNDCFVPPLVWDEVNTLDPKNNPAFDFCESVYFMAYDDSGKPVGRIAGIINRVVNEKTGKNTVRFGWVDFVDDPEVSEALFRAVEVWGR